MKDKKDSLNGKKALKCSPVDWDSYKIKQEEQDKGRKKKKKSEWEEPVVDDKWKIDKSSGEDVTYDFAGDVEFNRALESADKKKSGKRQTEKSEEQDESFELKVEKVSKTGKKKKSLNDKLDELGEHSSNWVSTGNFRSGRDIDGKDLDNLEKNIINTTQGASDDFLKNAVKEVSDALRDEHGYEPLGEVSLQDTFEIPELNIHFGDTADLKSVRDEIKIDDLKKQIDRLDLAASIEAQTDKELKEREQSDKIIVKSDELKRKRKKKKATSSAAVNPDEEKEPVKRSTGKKKTKKKTEENELLPEDANGAEKPVRKKKTAKKEEPDGAVKGKRSAGTKKPVKAAKPERPEKKPAAGKAGVKEEKKEKRVGSRSRTQDTDRPVRKKTAKPERKSAVKKTGRLPEKPINKPAKKPVGKNPEEKKGPSEFRKRSADWKDKKQTDKITKTVSFEEKRKELAERLKKVTPVQWTMVAMALVIFVTGIMTTAVYANYQGEQNKAIALASLSQYREDDSYNDVAQAVTEQMLPEADAQPEEETPKVLSLEMTSIEKDLKIKLVDDEDTLVKDVDWSVTVNEDNGEGGESDDAGGQVYDDEDRDGIIYIENIAAGDYSVRLNPSESLAAYILPQEKQLVSVKASIEYKVIANIKDEIKTEKEVNVALEDPNGNQAADVETAAPVNNDTVEWCESTKEVNGEEYVEATPDLSKTAASVKKDNGILTALKRIGRASAKAFSGRSFFGFNIPTGYLVATEDNQETNQPADLSEQTSSSSENESPTSSSSEQQSTETTSSSSTETSSPPSDEVTADPATGSSSETQQVQMTDSSQSTGSSTEEASLTISGSSSVTVESSVTITATYAPSESSVTWSISDSEIASISDNGSTCTVTGVKAGEATLTARCSNGKETTMKITVNASEANYSDDAKLYDASKNPLYVKDGDEYRLATYGDYKSGNYSVYYRKQEAFLYTGWQDIDGRTYYYRNDHTYVTGEQIIQGIKYNFGSDGALSKGAGTLGIDVSKYQPNINWNAVKASGVNYVIIRCGYRGASTGVLIQDPYFTSHIKGAKAAGLKVGVYFFTTALNETEAVEEASMCAALCSGYGINYPVFIDCEGSSRPGYSELSTSERTTIIKAFCNTIKSAGYTPGVYANKTWLSSKINTSALSGAKIWLAQYNQAGPTYSGRYDLWQYTSKGHVDGIDGYVDMNQSYLGY